MYISGEEKTYNLKLEEGYQEINIETDNDIELNLIPSSNSQVFFDIKKANSIKVTSTILQDSNCDLFFWNDSTDTLDINETYHVKKDASLRVGYGELSTGKLVRRSIINLDEEGAKGFIDSATLTSTKKANYLDIVSNAPNTDGEMRNFAVVLEGADLYIEATGKIIKGAHGAKSHQSSRSLTFDANQTSVILPKLLIDENDVEASHATSIGQIDENQLIYLESRGLTQREVTGLITIGYLKPIADFIDNESLKEKLLGIIESKVEETCSI